MALLSKHVTHPVQLHVFIYRWENEHMQSYVHDVFGTPHRTANSLSRTKGHHRSTQAAQTQAGSKSTQDLMFANVLIIIQLGNDTKCKTLKPSRSCSPGSTDFSISSDHRWNTIEKQCFLVAVPEDIIIFQSI